MSFFVSFFFFCQWIFWEPHVLRVFLKNVKYHVVDHYSENGRQTVHWDHWKDTLLRHIQSIPTEKVSFMIWRAPSGHDSHDPSEWHTYSCCLHYIYTISDRPCTSHWYNQISDETVSSFRTYNYNNKFMTHLEHSRHVHPQNEIQYMRNWIKLNRKALWNSTNCLLNCLHRISCLRFL